MWEYRLIIDNRNGNISGTIENTNQKTANFSPLTVLGDIVFKSRFLDFDLNSIERVFEYYFDISSNDIASRKVCWQYNDSLTLLEDMIYGNKSLSLYEFEKIRSYCQLKFDCIFTFYQDANQIRLHHGLSNLENVFEDYINKPHKYIYNCYSRADVLFSILHYLILNQYKFVKCHHCLRFFSAKTLKQKYCKRKSPCKGFEKYECEQAVREFRRKLSRRRKSISVQLSNYSSQEQYFKFLDICDTYKKSAYEKSTFLNLEEYEFFLSKKNIKQIFFLDSKKENKQDHLKRE